MGSQTLEILRQGVWASITGGWFYDPSQNLFCNTFHLYVWLFLLCLPFSFYVYLPPSKLIWYVYCCLVAIGLGVIKFVNYFLHFVYDTTECITETIEDNGQGSLKREEEGIELQDLSKKGAKIIRLGNVAILARSDDAIELQEITAKNTSDQATGLGTLVTLSETRVLPSTDSLESSDFQHLDNAEGDTRKPSGTIDLKAEVHRKKLIRK